MYFNSVLGCYSATFDSVYITFILQNACYYLVYILLIRQAMILQYMLQF